MSETESNRRARPKFPPFSGPSFTQVPDALFDLLLPDLTGAELKALLYIIRRTFGFKREADNISLSQMLNGIRRRDGTVLDRGVGLSKKSLLLALRDLEEMNLILRERRSSEAEGNQPTNYRLNVAESTPGVESTPPLGEKLHQGGGGESTPSPRGKNYTTQQTVRQQTGLQQTVGQDTEYSNNFELQTQYFNEKLIFRNSKNQIENSRNEGPGEGPSSDDAQEPRRRDDQSLTPTRDSFTAVGDLLKDRRIGKRPKTSSRSSKAATTAPSTARAGVRGRRATSDLPAPPEWLRELITRHSSELHDEAHTEQNIAQAHNLFLFTGAERQRFEDKWHEARRITLKRDIEKRANGYEGQVLGQRNKMPYQFKVVRDLFGLKDVPISRTRPKASKHNGSSTQF